MAVMRGEDKFLLEMGENPGMAGWRGGQEIFISLFTNWQRGAKPPIFQILFNPTPTVLFKLSCFCCPDHTTFEELFYLLIIC